MIYNTRITLLDIFSAQSSDTVKEFVDEDGVTKNVKQYDYYVLQVATAAGTDGALLVRSSGDGSVDITAAASVSNIWSYKGLYDLDTGAFIAGSTGVAPGGVKINEYKINIDAAHRMAFEISGINTGSYTVKMFGVSIYGN